MVPETGFVVIQVESLDDNFYSLNQSVAFTAENEKR